jgi:hypothetical protein
MTTTMHTTETGVAPVPAQQDSRLPADDPGIQADTHVQMNGELASRLMRSARWQQ